MEAEIRKGLPVLPFPSVEAWLAWLDANHASQAGVWLKIAKKGSRIPTVSYEEGRNAAIAYGWIDGLLNAYDENYYLIRFTPRKTKSGWSKVNRGVAEELIASGKMKPAGLAQVEAAKRDGRWEAAYDSPSTMQTPRDFQAALDSSLTAAETFAKLNSAQRYAFLYRLQTGSAARREEQIRTFVGMLEAGKTFHPPAGNEVP